MNLAAPASLWWLGMSIPVLALYVLRSRRVQVPISSIVGWDSIERPAAASRPWQRLRWSWPLVLQLMLVLLLALALSGPRWLTGGTSADHVVVILDTSASMAALDGTPDRIAEAHAAAESLLEEMSDDTVVSVLTAARPARLVASEDRPSVAAQRIRASSAGESEFDAEGVTALTASLDRAGRSIDFVLISDGGLGASEVRSLPAGTRFIPVGRSSANLSVHDITVSPRGLAARVLATVSNSGADPVTATVRVDANGVQADSVAVEIAANGAREVAFNVPAADRFEVLVDTDQADIAPADNRGWGVGPTASSTDVLVIGPDNPFLDAALASLPGVAATREDAIRAAAIAAADLVIFDRTEVPDSPGVPWMAIAPPDGAPGVTVNGSVDQPIATLVRSDTQLLADLDLSQLVIATAQRVDAPAATTLVGAEDAPLLVNGRDGDVPFVYLAADLENSNLGLLGQFPVLIERIVAELGGTALSSGTIRVGDSPELDRAANATVVSPTGRRFEIEAGDPAPLLDRAGIWSVESKGARPRLIVVNLPDQELDVTPADQLPIPGTAPDEVSTRNPNSRDLTPWILLAVLTTLAIEWTVSRRRRGVTSRQWQLAVFVRGTLAAAVVLALIAPTLVLSNSAVATVFVLDLSDSVASASTDGTELLEAALSSQQRGDLAGVVIVGSGARVDRAMADGLRFGGPRVQIDTSATDLAAGLRIASAMAPTTHARRIVLISDGRPTQGTTDAEIARLRQAGVQLDALELDPSRGADVLVRGVQAPPRVRRGDTVPIRVAVTATAAQSASIALLRDDVEVDRRLVDLPVGDSEVVFDQPAGDPSTVTWTAVVAGPANGVLRNDRGRTSTRIVGQASVVFVEGTPGNSGSIAAAMTSAGASIRVIEPAALDGLASIAGQDLVVLVDVPASALDPAQVSTLRSAVEDLGTGLLTIGGTSSYGAGGYLGTELEQLLPVDSEVKDPARQSRVAQVFAVDTSGSMGACHCAEGAEGGNGAGRLANGVRKTDIARDALVRATSEMAPDDSVGVLGLDQNQTWHVPLSEVGDGSQIRRGAAELSSGDGDFDKSTNLGPSLEVAAEALNREQGALRHIVLFTDGFVGTDVLGALAADAGRLREQGITVSVMGTGEGASQELAAVAEAGGGRYYRGRDLRDLPNLLRQETRIVSRQLIEEGEFLPEVTSTAPIVAGLTSAPSLGGYVATTAKPTAQTHLRIGDQRDPLLASWTVGLGTVASWTSDGGQRWAASWTTWDGAVSAWAAIMRSLLPTDAGAVRMRLDGTNGTIEAGFVDPVEAGAEVTVRVVAPDGTEETVRMERRDDRTFEAITEVDQVGTYALSATVTVSDQVITAAAGTADASFSREYLSEGADSEALEVWSKQTDGRGIIQPSQVFDRQRLEPGRNPWRWRPLILVVALLAVPTFVALSRLRRAQGLDAVRRRKSPASFAGLTGLVHSRRADRSTAGAEPDDDTHRPPMAPSPSSPSTTAATSSIPAPHVTPSEPSDRPPREPDAPTMPSSTPRPVSRTPAASGPTSEPSAAPGESDIGSFLEARRRRRSGDG